MARALIAALAIAAGCALGPYAAQAVTFSFATLDDPADPTFNQLLGINDSGVISGYFGSGAAGHPNNGYTIAPPYTTFMPDNYSDGGVQSQPTGINNSNQTSGFWSATNLGSGDNNSGFIRISVVQAVLFTFVNDPHMAGKPLVTQLLGINDNGNTVGFYNDATGASHGFAYSLSKNRFTPITVPHASSAVAAGINANNLICGFYTKGAVTYGFVRPEKGGTAVSFHVPKATVTQLLGINNADIAVGFHMGKDGIPHGLYYNPGDGRWQTVNHPKGANGTTVNGLNNKGQLVGFYTDKAGNTHGMIVTVHP